MKTLDLVRNKSNSSLGRAKKIQRKESESIEKKQNEVVRSRSEQRRLNQTAQRVETVQNLEKSELIV